MIKKVIQDPNPILHQKAQYILKTELYSRQIRDIIKNMRDTLKEQDGLGLAAPQIGELLSIFVIPDNTAPKLRTPLIPFSIIRPLYPTVFINPEIIRYSKEKETLDEGCLSVRDIFHRTPRAYKVKLKALDERGRRFTIHAEGVLARIFQHETDHLSGILFIERL